MEIVAWEATPSKRVAQHRAGHAARAAAAGPQLAAGDGHHLDALLSQPRVRLAIALVGHYVPWAEGERVVAVVPLLTLGGHRVESRVDDPQPGDVHRSGSGLQERRRPVDAQRA